MSHVPGMSLDRLTLHRSQEMWEKPVHSGPSLRQDMRFRNRCTGGGWSRTPDQTRPTFLFLSQLCNLLL